MSDLVEEVITIDLYEQLKANFNTIDENIFLKNFECYLKYDQDKDFVINLDNIVKYIGFSRKDNAKRLLVKFFTEKINYQVILSTAEQKKNAHNKETILLTPNTFKEFCIKANTDKAHQIRLYYIKMENILFKYLINKLIEIKKTLKDSNKSISMLKNKNILLEEELNIYITRINKKNYEFGETVYIVKELGLFNVFKVGSTINMNGREKAYNCHTNSSKIIYTKRCKNQKLLEDAMHHKFVQYKYNNRKDWFQIDFTVLQNALDELQLTLDGTASAFTFDEDMLNSDKNIKMEIYKKEDVNLKNEIIQVQSEIIQVQEKPKKPTIVLEFVPDFNKFISDCFTIDESYKIKITDLFAMFRLWSRNKTDFRKSLTLYLKNLGFNECFIYDPENKTKCKAFSKLKMIPLKPFVLLSTSTEVEKYAFENCTKIVTGRLTCKDIATTFLEWKKNINPNYTKYTNEDKKLIYDYFGKEFFPSTVHDGTRMRYGFNGICLIGNENIGKKTKNGNKKSVQQINPNTNEIIGTYESLSHASEELNITIPAISQAISGDKLHNGYKYKFTDLN
jgi:phage anti-repressor protein